MKSQDKLRTATLRMVLAAIQTEEVSGKQAKELTDDEVLKVLARESRKRGEAAEIYTQNGRGEMAANEHARHESSTNTCRLRSPRRNWPMSSTPQLLRWPSNWDNGPT